MLNTFHSNVQKYNRILLRNVNVKGKGFGGSEMYSLLYLSYN